MEYFKRPSVDSKFDKMVKLNHCLSVIGPRGAGKSTTVKNWIKSKNFKKIKWINVSSRLSLIEKIKTSKSQSMESIEEALDFFSKEWNNFDVIVWDDIHQISSQDISILVSFIKNSFDPPLNILISDEEIRAIKLDTSYIPMEPLDVAEVEQYIKNNLQLELKFNSSEVKKITGGLFHLINIWATSDQNRAIMSEAITQLFSKEEMINIVYLYFLKTIPVDSYHDSLFDSLIKRFFISKNENEYVLQSYLEDEVEFNFPKELKLLGVQKAFNYLKNNPNSKEYQNIFYMLLKVDLFDEAIHILPEFDLKVLEGLSEHNLKVVRDKCWILYDKLRNTDNNDSGLKTLRILLKAGFLLGQRKETLENLNEWINKSLKLSSWTPEHQWFCYELIYWYNRSGRHEEINQLLTKAFNLAQGELKNLLSIEMAYSKYNSDPKASLIILDRVVQSFNLNKEKFSKLTYAHALFLRGLCYLKINEFDDSLNNYTQSENIYLELKQFYLAIICRLNRVHIYSNRLEITLVNNLMKELVNLSVKYGYQYPLSGALYIKSKVHFEQFELNEALETITKALSLLPEGLHPDSVNNYNELKIKILLALGKYREAKQIFHNEIKSSGSVEIRLEFVDISYDEALDIWTNDEKNKNYISYYRFLLKNGESLKEENTQIFQRSLRGRWSLLENKIMKLVLSEVNRDELLKFQYEMQDILLGLESDTLEKFLFEFYKIELMNSISEEDRKEKYLQLKQKIELSSFDFHLKLPILAILEFKVNKYQKIQDVDLWKSCRSLDQRRFLKWSNLTNHNKKMKFLLITNDSKLDIEQWSHDLTKDKDLVLIENIGNVIFNEKEITEFHRKPILRQFLAVILEVFPNEVTKNQLAHIIWSEAYSPSLHDARIYTSIQRLRQLINSESIVSWNAGYKWNDQFSFAYIKSLENKSLGQHKIRTLIIQAMQNYLKNGKIWISRSELIEVTESSESTVKRELSKLLSEGEIVRKGAGPSVVYSLSTISKISS